MITAHKSHDSAHDLSTEDRKEMKDSTYAFPAQRKEPLNNASHVRNAIARFDQVKDVTDSEREEAFHHIQAAAKKFGVEMTETHWKQLGRKPHTSNSAQQ
jgi:cell division protein FtsX